jgi:hypothetical protein
LLGNRSFVECKSRIDSGAELVALPSAADAKELTTELVDLEFPVVAE